MLLKKIRWLGIIRLPDGALMAFTWIRRWQLKILQSGCCGWMLFLLQKYHQISTATVLAPNWHHQVFGQAPPNQGIGRYLYRLLTARVFSGSDWPTSMYSIFLSKNVVAIIYVLSAVIDWYLRGDRSIIIFAEQPRPMPYTACFLCQSAKTVLVTSQEKI